MTGKKVKWRMTWYGTDGTPTYAEGTVVAESGDWLVIKSHKFATSPHINPFVTRRFHEVELAS